MWVLESRWREVVRRVPKNSATEGATRKDASEIPAELLQQLASGEAALMLLEFLLFRLLDRGSLSAAEIVDAAEDAIAANRQRVADGDHLQVASIAAGKLKVLANSMAAAAIRPRPNGIAR
jgi:hypothetical protein